MKKLSVAVAITSSLEGATINKRLTKLLPKKLGLVKRIPAVAPPRETPEAKRQRMKQLSAMAIDLQRVALKDNIVRQLKCLGHTEKCRFRARLLLCAPYVLTSTFTLPF